MKRILLLEDRKPRQDIFLSENNIQLSELDANIDNKAGDRCKEIFESIKENGKTIEEILKDYDVIIAHRSGLVDFGIYNNFVKYFKDIKSKSFIVFSGGINGCSYTNKDFPFLLLNSKQIYTRNLIEFSDNSQIDINYLAYGNKWKINYFIRLSNLYQLIQYDEMDIDNKEIIQLEEICNCEQTTFALRLNEELGI